MNETSIIDNRLVECLCKGIKSTLIRSETFSITINDLNPVDFCERRTFNLSTGTINNNKIDFIFHDYCTNVFHGLRNHFGIINYFNQILDCRVSPFDVFPTPGKSGSTFYLKDQFMIKLIGDSEINTLLEYLNMYVKHVLQDTTLLPRYYGCYKLEFLNKTYSFIVTNYLFHSCTLYSIFDLKGSKRQGPGNKTFQDLDFINQKGQISIMDIHDRQNFIHMMRCDAMFLKFFKLMDYSLVLGIGLSSLAPNPDQLNCISYNNGKGEQYYMGIVDCLTKYTFQKQLQSNAFSVWIPKDELLAVPPSNYCKRFMDFIEHIVQ